MGKQFGLTHKFGTMYHPQSQGAVEWINLSLKSKLAKITVQTRVNRLDTLPIAPVAIRFSMRQNQGSTPYKMFTGRMFPGPAPGRPLQMSPPHSDPKGDHQALKALVKSFTTAPPVVQGPPPEPSEVSWVWLKVLKRKWSEPR